MAYQYSAFGIYTHLLLLASMRSALAATQEASCVDNPGFLSELQA